MRTDLGYAREKLNAARRSLMLPHPNGEAASLHAAFLECELGLDRLPLDDLDEDARAWVKTITDTMNTDGIKDSSRGTWIKKAESLTTEQKTYFSNAVDELGHWFDRNREE